MRAFVSLFIIVLGQYVSAATFHVKNDGVDGTNHSGGESEPWATLTYAVEQMTSESGDTILLGPGEFSEAGNINVPLGISIIGSGVESTTLTLNSGDGPILLFRSTNRVDGNQTVEKIRFDGRDRSIGKGILVDKRHNFTVFNCAFHRFSKDALHIVGSGNNGMLYEPEESELITGIEVAYVKFVDCGAGTSYSGYNSGMMLIGYTKDALLHNIKMVNDVSNSYGIKYSVNNGGFNYGMKIFDSEFDIQGKFDIELFNAYDGCEIYNCTLEEISMGANKIDPGPELDIRIHHNDIVRATKGTAIECQMADMQIDHNYFVNGQISIWSAGGGLDRPTSAVFEVRRNYLIHNNVFTSTPELKDQIHPIYIFQVSAINWDPSPFEIYNNTFYNVKRAVTIGMETEDWVNKVQDIRIKNNIIQNALSGLTYWIKGNEGNAIEDVVMTHNIFQNVDDVVNSFGGDITNLTNTENLEGMPGLQESGEKPAPYFILDGAEKLAHDAGTDVGLPFTGEAPDIGAFELGDTSKVIGNGAFYEPPTMVSDFQQEALIQNKALLIKQPATKLYNIQGQAVAPRNLPSQFNVTGAGNGMVISVTPDRKATKAVTVE